MYFIGFSGDSGNYENSSFTFPLSTTLQSIIPQSVISQSMITKSSSKRSTTLRTMLLQRKHNPNHCNKKNACPKKSPMPSNE